MRDEAGRPLTDSGDVGSNFATSDTVGPVVTGSVPSLDLPVDPFAPIRFDFSEAVSATPGELDGSGPTPAAQLFWQQSGGTDWLPIPVTMFLSRGGYSLVVQPPTGVTYQNDSLKRRAHLSRLRDGTGNPMADYDKAFRVYDHNPPHVDVAFPAGAPTGQLVGGTSYSLTPVLSSLDDLPQGDVDRVEYFLASSGDVVDAGLDARLHLTHRAVRLHVRRGLRRKRRRPPTLPRVGEGDGHVDERERRRETRDVGPPECAARRRLRRGGRHGARRGHVLRRLFARGDGPRRRRPRRVFPDSHGRAPQGQSRKPERSGRPRREPAVAGRAEAGGRMGFTRASGLRVGDPDRDAGRDVALLPREGDGRARRIGSGRVRALRGRARHKRTVRRLLRRATLGRFVSRFALHIGQKFVLEFRARDAETAVQTTSITLSGVFASPQAATLVGGKTNLYRTAELTVPATVPPGGQGVTATASATDWGGNTGTLPLTFTVSPTPDPYAPVAVWLTPWEGGAWPSGYASTVSAQGAAFLLRVRATDLDHVGGADVPGTIASVQFKGPVDAAGTLAPSFVDGTLVAGTGGAGTGIYEALWRVPNGVAAGTELPFQVRIVDAGANVTTADVRLRAAPPRKVYEAAQVAVLPDDTMLGAGGDVSGPVFLLDGAVLSLYPQTSPAVRILPSLYVYAGGVSAGASFTPTASVLTAPEVTSYASSVLYNPLELSVTDTFGVGDGARVDVTARGLLGSTPTQSMVLPGQMGSQLQAGGSHGGSGGPGSPNGGWARTDLTAPGSAFDLVTDPALPGGGGGQAAGPFGSTGAGGTGGGVVRLLAPGAVVHVEGDVLADGGNGPGDGGGGSLIGPGGAGGTIRIVASRLEGAGRISAAGGRGTHGFYAGGGGGGRIALSFAEPPAAGLPLTLAAPGGFNSLPPDANAQQIGGAGTIYLEELDALGAPKASGRLLVANATGKPAWPTPFSGPQRFGSVDGRGAARLVFADTLSVGATDPPAVNDRASVSLDASARLLLATEEPAIAMTASPDGGTVSVNQPITLTWTASDSIGIETLTAAFSPQVPTTGAYADEPLVVSQGAQPLVLTVPAAQPPGPITYTLTATDRAGRVASVQKTWNVAADTTPPVVTLTGLVAGGVYHAGQVVTATVTATDDGAIASLRVLLDGQTFPLTGAGPGHAFSYVVPVDLAAARDTTFQAEATDAAGNTTTTTAVALHFVLDAPPSLTLTGVTPGPSLLPGATIAATANASDDVAISKVVFTVSGAASTTDTRPVNAPSTTQSFSYPVPLTLTAGQTVTLQVDVFDSYGHEVSASPVTYTILLVGPPSKLSFGTQPSDTTVGASITPSVTVRILDDADNQTGSTAPVTVAIGTNPGGGTLSGTLTVAAVAGVASFGDLTIDQPGTSYTLAASGAGLTGATSSPFDISGAISVETAADGSGAVVPAQSIAAGSSLNVFAISRDAGNNFLANVVPDSWSLTGITGGVVTGDLVPHAAGSFVDFPIPSANTFPRGIAAGPDGSLWFTEYNANKIGRITTGGVITEFPIPTASTQPSGIAAGPDGNLWFTEYNANKIGRITTAGDVTEFPVPTANSHPYGIAAGPDGSLWFTEYNANKIGRITTAGVVTEFAVPSAGSQPFGIAAGHDGNIWFTESSANKIGRITTAGVVTEFPIPTPSGLPYGIAAGPDGNVWFTEFAVYKIGRITPAGFVTEFRTPTSFSQPYGIVAGPDRNIWFAENSGNRIGRITTTGVFSEFPIPTSVTTPTEIAAGPDGNIWFAESNVNKIGRIATGGSATFTGHVPGSAAIHASQAGLASTDSGILTVVPGATAATLAFETQPSGTTSGSPIIPGVTVRILDAGGNPFASTAPVTVAMGTNPVGGSLSGTLTAAAVAGVATFSDLSIDKAGTGYTLTASSSGLTEASSSTFDVTAGPASKLAFGTQPSNTFVGLSIVPAVTVKILDAAGNQTPSTAPVTAAIGTNPGGGTLSGTLTVSAVAGIATFNDLSIDRVGTGYTLTAAGAGLAGATSGMFNVPAGAATRILVETAADGSGTVVPVQSIPGGDSLRVYAVSRDANNNFVANVVPDSWSLAGVTGGVLAGDLVADAAGFVADFTIPTAGSSPYGIAAGPDGNLWFTENTGSRIGRITTGGVVTEFPIPAASSSRGAITSGSDGRLWFTEVQVNKIGRISTTGVVAEFLVPTAFAAPIGIASGPDGNLWFAENGGNKIGRITTAGVITEFPIPTASSFPYGIAAGPDGNLWFTENNTSANKIGRITTAGVVTEFTIPTAGSRPQSIAAGPDGNLWFTESGANQIGRITTAGVVTEFPVPTAGSAPYGIVAGSDGNLWFTELNAAKIGRITTAGVITEFPTPAGSGAYNVAAGPDGYLWTGEYGVNKIGRIATGGLATFTGHFVGSAAIHAVKAGLTSTDSGTLTVVGGAASKLAFGIQPSDSASGSSITPAVTVTILDTGGNQTSSTASVTLAIGTNPGGGTLSGTRTITAVAGVATFGDLSIDRVGTGYTLTAASAGMAGATSSTFTVTAGPASKLAFGAQPSSTPVGAAITPTVTVNILDAVGNPTTSTAAVAVAIGTNPGGGTLSGSMSVAAVAGVATFSNLSIDKPGMGYTLTAASAGLAGASSSAFNVTAGPAAKVLVETAADGSGTVVPSQDVPVGSSLAVYAISRDAGNNFVANVTPDGWSLTGVTGGVGAGDLVANAAGSVAESPVTAGSNPIGIAAGPDGNLWFTESAGNKIGRTTTGGVVTEFPIPTAGSFPYGIAAGPDGNLWFTEGSGNKIGRITTAGVVTEYPIGVASGPSAIAAGPDGNLWFTESGANRIGRITTVGVITEFTIPTAGSNPIGIAAGPDGNLWFTESSGNKIGRITAAGVVTEFSIPTAASFPYGIAAGPDGKLWFAENAVNKIGRISIAGVVTEFPIPTANSRPERIASGLDGNLWFTENNANRIGRISTAGVVTEFPIPTGSSSPRGIGSGPDGNLWFVEYFGFRIGRVATGGSATFTGHVVGSATIDAAKAGLTSTDSGTLTVVGGSSLSIRSLTLCSDLAAPLKPGSSFVACADTDARDVTLEISGAFEARVAGYGNCRDPIAIPGSARPGPLKIVSTARGADGRTASVVTHALVAADERAPVLVSVEPSSTLAFRSGDPLRIAVDAWDDVGIASVAITLGGQRTIVTDPPFEVGTLAPPVASRESLPVVVEVFDPSGNVSRRAIDLAVLPAGARLPVTVPESPAPGISLDGGRLSVDGGWPWRDADGEMRGRTLELPAIGTHTALAVGGANGTVVALDGAVARAAVHGGAVVVRRDGEVVGRFGIDSVSEDGLVLRLEALASGRVRRGDFLEGNWTFDSIELTGGARLTASDVVEAQTIHVDASSLLLSKNLQIPSSVPAPAECTSRGPRPDPPGTAPASATGVAP